MENMLSGYFTKPLKGSEFRKMRDIILSLPSNKIDGVWWWKGKNDGTKNDGTKNVLKDDWNSTAININDVKAVKKGNRRKIKQGERKFTRKLKFRDLANNFNFISIGYVNYNCVVNTQWIWRFCHSSNWPISIFL